MKNNFVKKVASVQINQLNMETISVILVAVITAIYVFRYLEYGSKQEHISKIYTPATINNEKQEKGNAFENFVLERFKKEYFTLLEWQSDKTHHGKYALSNMNPDMVFRYNSLNSVKFAVGCIWRNSIVNGFIEWAREYQLSNYKKFANEHRMPVFVILGIGGSPSKPESLFVMPINEIYSHMLSRQQLKRYYRFEKGNFFLQPESMKLI